MAVITPVVALIAVGFVIFAACAAAWVATRKPAGAAGLAGAPAGAADRRMQDVTCKRCGSRDVWRVRQPVGAIAEIMTSRGKKQFQCRFCQSRFYHHARRKSD